MKHHFVRRLGVLVAGASLTLGIITPAAQADATPSGNAAGGWLKGQLTNGLLHNDQYDFDDVGLSVDAALGLVAVGDVGGANAVADAVAQPATLADYLGDNSAASYAGSLAKAAVLAQATGRSANAFGGVNLISRLESQVSATDPTVGRISDTPDDFANVVGQTFAVTALSQAASAKTKPATDFLLKQQCAAGYFRTFFSAADAPAQSCDADAAEPSVDTTALAVLALAEQDSNAAAASAVARATSWLTSTQSSYGSFGGGTGTSAANTNSTGLAAAALGESCQLGSANRAASFVRTLQVGPAQGGTALGGQTGAVAYDTTALASGRAEGITVETQDQFRRATAQASLGLVWEAAAPASVTISAPEFVKPSSTRSLTVTGASAGETVCLTSPSGVTRLTGTGAPLTVSFTAPASGTAAYAATTGPGSAATSIKTLNKTKLKLALKKSSLTRGAKAVVKLRGLAAGESFKLKLRGKKVDAGTANSKGRATVRFVVKGKAAQRGKATLKVQGEFGFRSGKTTVRITR